MGGDCNCCSQKSFYPIQVERPSAGELAQCLVEEESLLAAVFYAVQSRCARIQDSGVETKGTPAFMMPFLCFRSLYFCKHFFLLPLQREGKFDDRHVIGDSRSIKR